MDKIKLALIGCGAVTERCHLPAAKMAENCEVVMLVDKDLERIKRIAKKFNIPSISADYLDVINRVDAVVLALPHSLHAPVGIQLLKAGIHVLVEKPMAITTAECMEMLKAADTGKAILAASLMRRFLHSALFVKNVIESGMLGHIQSFDFREGNVYNWPVSSDFFFRKDTAGGGVLFDMGAHTLDLLIWWLGDVSLIEYFDDSHGGVEADCEIHLETKSGTKGFVELSRTRDLRNTAIIKGERGQIEVNLRKNSISLLTSGSNCSMEGHGQILDQPDASGQGFLDLFYPQIKDFTEAIRKQRSPKVSGTEAIKSIALIEECYRQKKPLRVPWLTASYR